MPNIGVLRTLRLSATSGTRTIGSMIASSVGGAGSPIRVYKFIAHTKRNENLSPSDYFFNFLDGKRSRTPEFNTFYQNYSPNP